MRVGGCVGGAGRGVGGLVGGWGVAGRVGAVRGVVACGGWCRGGRAIAGVSRGVRSLTTLEALGEAPLCRRFLTMFRWPMKAATCRGVRPDCSGYTQEAEGGKYHSRYTATVGNAIRLLDGPSVGGSPL